MQITRSVDRDNSRGRPDVGRPDARSNDAQQQPRVIDIRPSAGNKNPNVGDARDDGKGPQTRPIIIRPSRDRGRSTLEDALNSRQPERDQSAIRIPSRNGTPGTPGTPGKPGRGNDSNVGRGSIDIGNSLTDNMNPIRRPRNAAPETGGLQTIEKSPIKPDQFKGRARIDNGGAPQVGALQDKTGKFKGPAFDGPFKGRAFNGPFKGPACGHIACGGFSHCSFSSRFHHHVRHSNFGFHGFHSGFSFIHSSSGFFFGFNTFHGSCFRPHFHSAWCDWPRWHSFSCHCSIFHCVHRFPRTVFVTSFWPATYYYPVYSEPIYYSSADTYTPAPQSYEPYEMNDTAAAAVDGWDYLDQGDAREARRLFAREIGLHPNDGLPQIGYAISSTLIERKIEAISMMRRALKNDPESIHEIPQSQGIALAMEQALDEYIEMSDRRPDNVDAQFMIAALRYMLGDTSRAFFAIDRAMDWGDKDASAANLHAIIRSAMEQQSQPAPAPAPLTEPMGEPAYVPMYELPPIQSAPSSPDNDDTRWEVPF